MAAGQAAALGEDQVAAARLLRQVIERASDPVTKADAQLLLAHATVWTEPPAGHLDQLLAAAAAVLPHDKQRSATLLALAAIVAIFTGRLDVALTTATRAVSLGRAAAGACCPGYPHWRARASSGRRAAGRDFLREIMAYPGIDAPNLVFQLLRMRCGQSLTWCEEYLAAEDLLRSSVAAGRVTGRVDDLPYALAALSELYFRTGDWGRAYAHAAEAIELGDSYRGNINLSLALVFAAHLDAATGAATACRERTARGMRLARSKGVEVTIYTHGAAALGLLALGTGDYPAAAAQLGKVAALISRHGVADPCVIQWRPDYIEALTRLGRTADALEQLAVLEAEALSVDSAWATATAARCRGMLLKPLVQAIAQLEEAVALAEASTSLFEQARARLSLGEVMHRSRRRGDAARQLEQAYLAFEQLGAQPWTERAAGALAAAGVPPARGESRFHRQLTAQELRVALQVADGLTNQEVAARLFLSHKTVEVHLGHIYSKLGIRSRANLVRLIDSGAVASPRSDPPN